ncbi:hypothetical protein SAMN05421659_1291, partial [[Clostridium] fimetarium]
KVRYYKLKKRQKNIDFSRPIAIFSLCNCQRPAIFLHCSNDNGTYGCVSIPETSMELVLQHIHSGCVIVIDTADGIYSY